MVASQATLSMPNQPSTVLARPKRTPLKIDSFQISEATTYEHAVGRKNTERKKARAKRIRFTSSARPSDSAKVSGTMKTAKTVKVPRLARNGPGRQHVDVVLQPDAVAGRDRVLGAEEAQDERPDDRHVDEDQQADEERADEEPEGAGAPCDAAASTRPRGRGRSDAVAARWDDGRGAHAQPNSRLSSASTVFSALAISASRSPPLRDDGGGSMSAIGRAHLRRPVRVAGMRVVVEDLHRLGGRARCSLSALAARLLRGGMWKP